MCFSDKNEQHSAKLSFSAVFFGIFEGINKKYLFWVKKCFSHQNEQDSAKLSFSGVLKFFVEIDQKNFFLSKKNVFLIEIYHIQ